MTLCLLYRSFYKLTLCFSHWCKEQQLKKLIWVLVLSLLVIALAFREGLTLSGLTSLLGEHILITWIMKILG